jgi:hypothetical protein
MRMTMDRLSDRFGSLMPEKRADRFYNLPRQHIKPAVVFLIDQFAGLVDGQPPEPNCVHLFFDTQVDACTEDRYGAIGILRKLV